MKISEIELSRLLALSNTSRTPASRYGSSAVAEVSGSRYDSDAAYLDVSPTAQEIQRVKSYIQSQPDVRQDRVNELKAKVEAGTYHVSSEDVADLIIRRVLADTTSL